MTSKMTSWVSARPASTRQRERHAGEHQADRVGQAQPARDDRDQNGEAEQAQRAEEHDVHAGRS